MTLGMLTPGQADRLAEAGLDYYNHNVDTSPEYYGEIISTRTYQERLDTLENVRAAGMKVCCGGIVGMGEARSDRAGMIRTLANLPEHPESVPINMLMQVEGTPLHGIDRLDVLEFVRVDGDDDLSDPCFTVLARVRTLEISKPEASRRAAARK